MAVSTLNIECKRYGCMKNLLACYANCRYNTRCEDLRGEVIERTKQASGDINAYLSERGRAPITIQILKRGLKFAESEKTAKKAGKRVDQTKPSIVAATETSQAVEPVRKLSKKSKRKTARPRKLVAVERAERKEPKAVVKVGKPRAAFYLEKERTPEKPAESKPVRSATISVNKASLQMTDVHSGRKKTKKIRSRKKKNMPKRSNRLEATSLKNNARPSESQLINTEASAEKKLEPKKSTRRNSRNNGAKKTSPGGKGKLYIILEGKSASLVDELGLMSHMLNHDSTDSRYFEAREVEARLQIVPKA